MYHSFACAGSGEQRIGTLLRSNSTRETHNQASASSRQMAFLRVNSLVFLQTSPQKAETV